MTHIGKVAATHVIVEWMDSRRPDAGWKHLGDAQNWTAVKCASVGWLVADGLDRKVLAPNMAEIDDASNRQLAGEIVIPTSCVLRVTPLTESSSARAESKRSRQRT